MSPSPTGLTTSYWFLDSFGTPIKLRDSFHKVCRKYKDENIIEETYFDVDDNLTSHPNGSHGWKATYDELGNKTECAYFDEKDEKRVPVMIKDGYTSYTSKYDARGNCIELAFFGLQGEPIINLRNGTHREVREYDERCNMIQSSFYDEDKKPILNTDEHHRATAKYDEWGNQIRVAYFDQGDQATRHRDGHHSVRAAYDERRNLTEIAYFDEQDQPVGIGDGYTAVTRKYDEDDNQRETTYYYETRPHDDGYQVAVNEYDEQGNRIRAAYLNENLEPVLLKDSYASINYTYKQGNQTEWACFGLNEEPVNDRSDGTHRTCKKYDNRGNQIEWTYFDKDQNPARHADGNHKATAEYDERGNRIETAYFDESGKPVGIEEGYTRVTKKYDEHDTPIETSYHYEAAPHANGYRMEVHKHDQRGLVREIAYFDENREPLVIKDGYASLTAEYDEVSNIVSIVHRDIGGRPNSALKIVEVLEGGEGEAKELRSGDVIVRYNGKHYVDFGKFMNAIKSPANEPRELVIERDGTEIFFQVAPGLLPARFGPVFDGSSSDDKAEE